MDDVTVCNLALAALGDTARLTSLDPSADRSVQALHCARFYPVAREIAVARHTWDWATRRATLVPYALDDVERGLYPEWAGAFALPGDCLRPVELILWTGLVSLDQAGEYRVEIRADGSRMLLTNTTDGAGSVGLRYVRAEFNPARWPALFTRYLAFELAALIGGPLQKSDSVVNSMLEKSQAALIIAAGVDSNSSRDDRARREYRPDWIAKR